MVAVIPPDKNDGPGARSEVQRLRAALEVFADRSNWERKRWLDPPTWDGDVDEPWHFAREALGAERERVELTTGEGTGHTGPAPMAGER